MALLSSCRVLDLTDESGWVTGRVLSDLGAIVVKVDPPGVDRSATRWSAYNAAKEQLPLDITTPEGRECLDSLLTRADILLETAHPADTSFGDALDPDRIAALCPRLVHVSLTPFGRSGPKSRWLASDLELMAAGGAMWLAGEPDGEPMRVSEPQSPGWAGAAAALGALVALAERGVSGVGQHVDVSAQAAVIPALAHAPTFSDLLGEIPTRAGAFVTGRSVAGARFRAFWQCADGFINFILYGGPAGRRTNLRLVEWMVDHGHDPGPLRLVDWEDFTPTNLAQDAVDALEEPIAKFFIGITKREFLEEAARREILGYPVSTMADIAADPQLEAREYWQELPTGENGTAERHCGAFVRVDGERPGADAGSDLSRSEVLELFSTPETGGHEPSIESASSALGGLNVVVFGGYAAGPHIGKLLANFGATVVHVESVARPDGFRLEYPPFKDRRRGINRGGCFAYFNDSKLGVTLDLKNPAGSDLARRLLAWTDIVVENMRPGVMDRLGLGYEAGRALNPGLIMISTCNMGRTGPRAHTPGFGSQLSALAGFCGLTGEPGGPPMLLYGPYIDFIASTLGGAAVLAALERRRETGRGGWIDMAQYEAGLLFMAGALLDHERHGIVASRRGNRSDRAFPHGAFQCADGAWVALSCWNREQFSRLAETLGEPGLTEALPGADNPQQAERDAIDATIAGWVGAREAAKVASTLQGAGVPASVVATVADLFVDPQLAARGTWRRMPHPEIGSITCLFPPFDLSRTPGDVTRAAPLLGEHNDDVFRDLLGLSDDEYAEYATAGAFD